MLGLAVLAAVMAAVPYRRDFPYGVSDERWAAARGYGLPATT